MYRLLDHIIRSVFGTVTRNSAAAVLCASLTLASAPGCSEGKLPDGTELVPGGDGSDGSNVDLPRLNFTEASDTEDESTGSKILTVSLSEASADTVTVSYSMLGTATGGGVDYTLSTGTLSFAAGVLSQTITLTIVEDSLNELDETVVISLGSPTNALVGSVGNHAYTILDNDPEPSVEFGVTTSASGESTTPGLISIVLSAVSGRDITVDYTLTAGTATNPSDYSGSGGSVTIPAGQTTHNIPITVVSDSIDESNETIDLSIDAADGATLGTVLAHTYTINDDDAPPSVQFGVASSAGPESTSPAVLTITLSGASGNTIDVDYNVTGGTATGSGTDYTLADGTLTFNPGETSKNIAITVLDDATDETDETITIALSNPVLATLGAQDTHTYTIQDNDKLVSFDLASSGGGEGTTPSLLGVSLSGSSALIVTVNYAVTGGTATGGGADYTLASGNLTFSPGETAKNLSLAITDDTTDEDDETLTVTLSSPSNASLGATTAHTYTITDDDLPPSVAFDAASSSAAESVASAQFAVSLSGPSGKTITVDYAVSGGTATGSGTDYTLASGTLTFLAGETSKNVSATIAEDLMTEADETLQVTISNPSNVTLGATTVHEYTIIDNDPMPAIDFALSTSSGAENATPALLEVVLSNTTAVSVTVDYTVTGGTATGAGTDYTLASGTLTFAAGISSQNVSLAIVDDAMDELDETVQVTISNPTNGNLGTTLVHSYTILDNDPEPTVAFSAASSNGSEASSPALLAVALSAASGKTVTVDYAVTGGTATGAGTDYTLASGTLTFAAGVTSQDISLAVVNDLINEADETVQVTISNPSNATLGATTAHAYTINDNDAATVEFAAASSSGGESSTPALLTVNLTPSSAQTITVDYAVTGGTATGSGTDFTLASGTLTFNPGETSKDISVTVINDTTDEDDETLEVTLSNPSNASVGTNGVHTYTITDDDAAPTVTYDLASSSGGESGSPAFLGVSLSAVSGKTVTVDYAVTGGTATGSGTDYTLAAGTLTFNPGTTALNIAFTVNNDALDENDETVIADISNPANATLGATTSHTYTINDDDAAPTIAYTLASSAGSEASTPALLAVTLSAASGKTVTVDYAVTGGTATGSGTDYTLTAGTLTFSAGVTSQNVSITVTNDTLDEDDETVIADISNPANATLGATTSHTYTITDDDASPSVAFSATSSSASEISTPALLAVSLSAASGRTVTVDYAVTGGTATGSGTDYTLASGTLTFNAGVTSQNVSLTVVDDLIIESNETVIVGLSTPTNASLGGNTSHTYTILENETCPGGWWDCGWAYRVPLTFDNSASGTNLVSFPVLVLIDEVKMPGIYSNTQAAGQDLRFVDADGVTVLNYEIENWNTSGVSAVWVNVPQVDLGSTTDSMTMYYGNSGAPAGQNKTAVWDASYLTVHHLNETSGTHLDSTSYANNGTNSGSTQNATGKIAGANSFNGTSAFVSVADAGSLGSANIVTVSAWINASSVTGVHGAVSKGDLNYWLGTSGTESMFQYFNTAYRSGTTASALLATGTWYNLTVSAVNAPANTTDLVFYVNGVQNSTANTARKLLANTTAMRIGSGPTGEFFNGTIDEVRVSNIVRSADWIRAEYLTGDDQFITYGTVESR